MTYENPRLPEGINVARESVPMEFLRLLAGLLVVVVVAALVLHLAGGWLARQIPFALERAWVGERLLVPPGIGTDVAGARAQDAMLVAAVGEAHDARVLEEAPDEGTHADVLRELRHPGTQRAHTAHDQLDFNACL